MLRLIFLAFLIAGMALPAAAQLNYGGHAAPSLDVSLSISNDILRQEIGNRAANGGLTASQRRGGGGGLAGSAGPVGLFSNALVPLNAGVPSPSVDTRFARSAALQKKSEAGVLAQLQKRSPAGAADTARVFREYDIAQLFRKATAAYGFRDNDIADTLAAYWLVSWVIANDARDFSVPAARAVRDQVAAGIARTPVGSFSPEKKHQLADEAIINTLMATQMFEYAQSGKVPRDQYRRIGDDLQRVFLGFGADLRALKLTDRGFAK